MFFDTNLPPNLRALKDEIEGYARGYGLDFYETIFEVIDADDLNEIAAYGGFPTRYPHWSFGMQYNELKKSYEYGLSKIYEMVINNDPCYAYLMRCNHEMDQKLVMAHVYGHCDFFKNNAYFAHTTRKMMDEIANHASRIRHHVEKYGEEEVESFLDRCMSLDDLIDIHSTFIKRRDDSVRFDFTPESDEAPVDGKSTRFKAKGYMEDYINPQKAMKAEEAEQRREQEKREAMQFPSHPEKDVLLFLIEYAPMKNWQRDILSIIRDEAYYFYPQGQTKIMNEGWACLKAGSLVLTDGGLRPIEQIVSDCERIRIHDGESTQKVYDWASFPERETVWIKTRRGLIVEGSRTHQMRLVDGSWKRLDEVALGDRLVIAKGTNLWAIENCVTTQSVDTQRSRVGLCSAAASQLNQGGTAVLSRCRIPSVVDESLASFFGMLIGGGYLSEIRRTVVLTSDESQFERITELTRSLFGISPRTKMIAGRTRLVIRSEEVKDFLLSLGLGTRIKSVPDVILRSPKSVVAAFLRSLYDCDGYAGSCGVILATSSEKMSEVVQILLLNFGILSTRRPHKDGCWHVHTQGRSVELFGKEIGFGLARKTDRLNEYVQSHQWFKVEPESDTIVSIEHRRAEVFDISVEESHRYVAQGLINHNSYWHSTMMTQKILQPSEVIDYADHHSGTMATSGKRLNPYKLGIELFRDIEHRWNTGKFGAEYEACDNYEEKRRWNRPTNLGRAKIFETRKIHNDITFIDTFLTPEFCREYKLFSFNYQDQQSQYVIESREFEKVKQRLLFSLTNFGKPWIYAINGNHRNRGELLLRHQHTGVDLKMSEATDALKNLQFIWTRPVHLETVVDGKPTLLSFDGTDHTQKGIGEVDEPKRNPAPKTK